MRGRRQGQGGWQVRVRLMRNAPIAKSCGYAYAVALGVMIGTLQIVYSAGLAESLGTKHLGTIRGTVFVIGVSGAAAGPLPFLWSPMTAYWVFLAIAAVAVLLGLASLRPKAQGK